MFSAPLKQQTIGRVIGIVLVVAPGMLAAQQTAAVAGASSQTGFNYEERSTVQTIPFESLDQDAMSNTVIEGGLEAPASGVPARPVSNPDEDYYLDPLALQPRDERTDLGRFEIPAEIKFSAPKSVPGQTFGNNYVIRPPENRTYDALNTNIQGR